MNALVSRILVLSGPVQDPKKFAAYLANLPTARLQQKIRDLEESHNRTGGGYRPFRGIQHYESSITPISPRTTSPAQGPQGPSTAAWAISPREASQLAV